VQVTGEKEKSLKAYQPVLKQVPGDGIVRRSEGIYTFTGESMNLSKPSRWPGGPPWGGGAASPVPPQKLLIGFIFPR